MKTTVLAVLSAAVLFSALSAGTASPIRVMLLDGESGGTYHNWQALSPALKKQLDETGLFQVDVVTAPSANSDFSSFKPEFNNYQVVVFNYDAPDARWSAELKEAFEKYMMNGGGLVIVHAADNAFPGWQAYNDMIGIGGWRGRSEKSGPLWYFTDGKPVSDNSPGSAGSHGKRLPYRITVQDASHPITRGLPKVFMHQGDELYARMRGPGKSMTVLATAYSEPSNRGTGHEEPALMVLTYGKGRIFHSIFGHDVYALSSVDAVVTFQRGTEWSATGKVTQKVPATYPTADTVSYRADIAAMDPNYVKGLNGLDAGANVSGKYAGTVEIPAGVFQVTLTLVQKGDEITGAVATQSDSYPVQRGKLSGKKLAFEVLADQTYAVECDFENDRLTGDVKPAGGGAGKISVSRTN